MKKNAQYWINKLNLQEHPEGGYFVETYRSNERIHESKLPDRYKTSRVFGTSIYFLLTRESVSNFHRLSSDEIWHFHTGGKARIHMISETGDYQQALIGEPSDAEVSFQAIISQNTWFAAEVIEGDYILVGCTVAPGFEFEDFILADRQSLLSAYPMHKNLIERFTKK